MGRVARGQGGALRARSPRVHRGPVPSPSARPLFGAVEKTGGRVHTWARKRELAGREVRTARWHRDEGGSQVAARKKSARKKTARKKTARKKSGARKKAARRRKTTRDLGKRVDKEISALTKEVDKRLKPLRQELQKAERKAGTETSRVLREARKRLNDVELKGGSEFKKFLRQRRRDLSKALTDLSKAVRPARKKSRG